MQRWFITLLCYFASITSVRADDWPQWMGQNRDGIWNETGMIEQFPEKGPKVLWRKPINGGYSGPAVVNGKVYVFDFIRKDGKRSNNPGARGTAQGEERVLCLDARSGEQLWEYKYPCNYKISYDSGPRCTPTVADGMVYCLGAEGNLTCLDANTGSRVWTKDLKTEYQTTAPIWGFSSHPLVDGDKVICGVGGKGSVLVAFDKKTGKELWKALSAKEQGYCPPVIYQAGGVRQLIHWNADNITSVDPETGKQYWSEKLAPHHCMSIMSPRKEGDYLFAGGIGFASLCLKFDADKPTVTVAWKGERTSSLCPVNSTPIIENGYIYGVDQPGPLRCVELKSGKRLWETFMPTVGKQTARQMEAGSATAFLVKNGNKYFIMSETGHLIIAKLTPQGYQEVSRTLILDKTNECFGRDVVWSHPAFANKCCYARNDKEIVCISLAKE